MIDTPKRSLWQRLKDVALLDVGVLARGGPDKVSLERLEQTLLEADLGVAVTARLVAGIERRAKRGELKSTSDFRAALVEDIAAELGTGNSGAGLIRSQDSPTVLLILGVNGAGKTTFIGKLATQLRREGHRVLVAAGDTFRAGAVNQLRVWAERSGAEFVAGRPGGDPAAVGFDAIDAAIARGCDTVIIDTAGPAAHERRADGRTAQGAARRGQAAAGCAARGAARARRYHRAERDRAGKDVLGGGAVDGDS